MLLIFDIHNIPHIAIANAYHLPFDLPLDLPFFFIHYSSIMNHDESIITPFLTSPETKNHRKVAFLFALGLPPGRGGALRRRRSVPFHHRCHPRCDVGNRGDFTLLTLLLMAGWWFGCHQFYFPRNIGLRLWSQLTNSYFSEGWPNHQPG